jgi:outer membrane protein OmpA-like peptidoglycan-associated protein
MKINKFYYILLPVLLLILPACYKKKIVTNDLIDEVVPTVEYKQDVINQDEVNLDNIEKNEDINEYELVEDENPLSQDNIDNIEVDTKNDKENSKIENKDYNENINTKFKTIFFDFNKYNLKPNQKDAIEYNCKIAKELTDKGYDIVIEGHSCNITSSTSYNIMLSEERAKSVAKEFKKYNIDENSIKTIGRGAEMPIVESGNIEQQSPNRRVEIYAYKK